MAKIATMEFKKYDGVTHTLFVPNSAYVAGATLRFTAKPQTDSDVLNNAAVINKPFTDANVTTVTTPSAGKLYTLPFIGATDIVNVTFANGETEQHFVGEFKYIVSGRAPVTYPGNDDYIDVVIYANVQNGVS